MLKRVFAAWMAILLLFTQIAYAQTAVVTTISTKAERAPLEALLGEEASDLLVRLFGDTFVTGASGKSGGTSTVHMNGVDLITLSSDLLKNMLYLDSPDVLAAPLVIKGYKAPAKTASIPSNLAGLKFSDKNTMNRIYSFGSSFSRSNRDGVSTTTITLWAERLCEIVKAAAKDLKESPQVMGLLMGITGMPQQVLEIGIDLLADELCTVITDYLVDNVELKISSVNGSKEQTITFTAAVRKAPKSKSLISINMTCHQDADLKTTLELNLLDEHGEGYVIEGSTDENGASILLRSAAGTKPLLTISQVMEDEQSVITVTSNDRVWTIRGKLLNRSVTATVERDGVTHTVEASLPDSGKTLVKVICDGEVCLSVASSTSSADYKNYGSRRQKAQDLNKIMTNKKTFDKWYVTVEPGLKKLGERFEQALTR